MTSSGLPTTDEIKTPLLELTYNRPLEDGSTPEKYTGDRNFGHLAYAVEDIYGACQSLQDTGVTINRPSRDGQIAFMKSPDEISIKLVQRGESLESLEPWQSMKNVGSCRSITILTVASYIL